MKAFIFILLATFFCEAASEKPAPLKPAVMSWEQLQKLTFQNRQKYLLDLSRILSDLDDSYAAEVKRATLMKYLLGEEAQAADVVPPGTGLCRVDGFVRLCTSIGDQCAVSGSSRILCAAQPAEAFGLFTCDDGTPCSTTHANRCRNQPQQCKALSARANEPGAAPITTLAQLRKQGNLCISAGNVLQYKQDAKPCPAENSVRFCSQTYTCPGTAQRPCNPLIFGFKDGGRAGIFSKNPHIQRDPALGDRFAIKEPGKPTQEVYREVFCVNKNDPKATLTCHNLSMGTSQPPGKAFDRNDLTVPSGVPIPFRHVALMYVNIEGTDSSKCRLDHDWNDFAKNVNEICGSRKYSQIAPASYTNSECAVMLQRARLLTKANLDTLGTRARTDVIRYDVINPSAGQGHR